MPNHARLVQATRTDRFLGRCEHCVRPIAVEDAACFTDIKKVTCPDCGTFGIKLERLYGTLVSELICDSRCQSAIGATCECACGGANHGAGFLRHGQALASAILAYRRTTERRRVAAQTRADNRRAARAAAEEARLATYRGQWGAALARIEAYSGNNSFLNDIRRQHTSGRELSERQINAFLRVLEQDNAREIQRAEERANATPAILGNGIVVEGRVISTRMIEGDYGTQYKMLVLDDRGFKVWSTIPATIFDCVRNLNALTGRRVNFTANLVAGWNDDNTFCQAKRPRKGSVLAVTDESSMDPA